MRILTHTVAAAEDGQTAKQLLRGLWHISGSLLSRLKFRDAITANGVPVPVIDPRNGDVLALASAPGFDPNDFVPVFGRELYERYTTDPNKPLLNRACGGAYAPGSTFKPVVALAALSLGVPAKVCYTCTGVFELGPMKLRCTSRWGHGALDLRRALMKSCNPFFCNLGFDIGTNAVCRAAEAFGLGSKTGLDFGVDMSGTVPDAEWKARMYGEKWYQDKGGNESDKTPAHLFWCCRCGRDSFLYLYQRYHRDTGIRTDHGGCHAAVFLSGNV